ncbi:FABP family protein [Microbacterium sp. CIAB417]|uniref:FABP family protein n=1 Tax=Microbacterium sp. CIAB417 TaxID=2860287 RepID=UPI001FAD4318|nr:FABP family protein [Microbacterium sp. CIAB417]
MLELPTDLPADLAPLSWLLGVWEGTGVIDYHAGDHHFEGEFTHRVSFSHDGGPFLNYAATGWVPRGEGEASVPLVAESGFWRIARPAGPADAGPALLPPLEDAPARTVDDVELLRAPSGGFPLEVSIAHSDGALELYLGEIAGPRIDIATDAIVRGAGGKDYAAATRMYGLVEGHLLWAWDIAALGSELKSHASARLAKV